MCRDTCVRDRLGSGTSVREMVDGIGMVVHDSKGEDCEYRCLRAYPIKEVQHVEIPWEGCRHKGYSVTRSRGNIGMC